MKVIKTLCILALMFSMTASLHAATPAGERGGALSASEEAQQHFLRRLRHEIAVQRILSKQLVDPRPADKLTAAPPIVQHKLLKSLTRDGVSAATLAALKNYPAIRRQEYKNSKNTQTPKNTSTIVVDETWKKLEGLFEKRYGEKLDKPAATETAAPKGT